MILDIVGFYNRSSEVLNGKERYSYHFDAVAAVSSGPKWLQLKSTNAGQEFVIELE